MFDSISEWLFEVWSDWFGKSIAILGERGTGKTHLVNFLTRGSIPEISAQTTNIDRTKAKRIKLKDLELKIKSGRDLPGSKEYYGEWEKTYASADIVLYLFKANLLASSDRDHEERTLADLNQIDQWRKEYKGKKFLFVGTHCDLIPEFSKLTGNNQGDFRDRIGALQSISHLRALAGGIKNTNLVLGSMKSKEGTEKMAFDIINCVNSNS